MRTGIISKQKPTSFIIILCSAIALLTGALCFADENRPPPTIAIIIDDLGNHKDMGDRLINIPAPLTLAFLPMRLHTKKQAKRAYYSGKEVMLHAPMENTRNIPLGRAGLKSSMSDLELVITFRRALRSVPHLSGVNNHMGSVLTQNRRAMSTLMRELSDYPLYFVDSKTTPSSIAYYTANRYDIPALDRDIFLDNNINTSYIHRQFRKLVEVAKEKGTAIGIGHPHLKTVRYLERILPQMGKEGIAVATVKGVWAIRNNARDMFASRKKPSKPLLAESRRTVTQQGVN